MESAVRKKYTDEEILNHLQAQESNNWSVPKYCKEFNIAEPTFRHWKYVRFNEKPKPLKSKVKSKTKTNFISMKLPQIESSLVEIKLPNDIQIKIPQSIDVSSNLSLIKKLYKLK